MPEFNDPKETIYGWYVGTTEGGYLHSNITIYPSTCNPDGGYSGYFRTQMFAQIAIDHYNMVKK